VSSSIRSRTSMKHAKRSREREGEERQSNVHVFRWSMKGNERGEIHLPIAREIFDFVTSPMRDYSRERERPDAKEAQDRGENNLKVD
jgi:hypothetical protein